MFTTCISRRVQRSDDSPLDDVPRDDTSPALVPKPERRPADRHVGPRFPFCEAYDGVNMRRTETISQSIQACIQHHSLLDPAASRRKWYLGDETPASSDGQYVDLDINPNRKVSLVPGPTAGGKPGRERAHKDRRLTQARLKLKPDHLFVLSGTGNTTHVMSDLDPALGVGGKDVKGYVDMYLDYRAKENCLNCTINGGKVVKKHRTLPSTFVTVNLAERGEKRHHSRVAKRSREPKFEDMFVLEHVNKVWIHVLVVRVQLWHKRMFRNVLIGKSFIWLDDIDILSYEKMNVRVLLK